jgi:site-specific recombinase XerD
MENEINGFMDYLAGEKGASKNTQLSYERDINQLKKYLEEKGITDVTRVEFLCPLSGKRRKGDNDDFQNVGVHKGIFSL